MTEATNAFSTGLNPMSGSTLPDARAPQEADDARQQGADGKRGGNHPVDVDAHELGGQQVLRGGAHGDPDVGARHEQGEGRQEHGGHDDGNQVQAGQAQLAHLDDRRGGWPVRGTAGTSGERG